MPHDVTITEIRDFLNGLEAGGVTDVREAKINLSGQVYHFVVRCNRGTNGIAPSVGAFYEEKDLYGDAPVEYGV